MLPPALGEEGPWGGAAAHSLGGRGPGRRKLPVVCSQSSPEPALRAQNWATGVGEHLTQLLCWLQGTNLGQQAQTAIWDRGLLGSGPGAGTNEHLALGDSGRGSASHLAQPLTGDWRQ